MLPSRSRPLPLALVLACLLAAAFATTHDAQATPSQMPDIRDRPTRDALVKVHPTFGACLVGKLQSATYPAPSQEMKVTMRLGKKLDPRPAPR